MITFLSKFFIKEKEDKGKIRQEYGILCGMVGIFLNILLFCGKFFENFFSGLLSQNGAPGRYNSIGKMD